MKHLFFAIPAGLFGFGTFAQTQPPIAEYAPWAQFGAIGLLGFLVYYLIVKQGPKERAEAREERAADRAHMSKVVSDICEQFERTQERQHVDTAALTTSVTELAERIVQR